MSSTIMTSVPGGWSTVTVYIASLLPVEEGGRARRGMVISRIGAREIEAGELARVGYRTLGATSRESPYDI